MSDTKIKEGTRVAFDIHAALVKGLSVGVGIRFELRINQIYLCSFDVTLFEFLSALLETIERLNFRRI